MYHHIADPPPDADPIRRDLSVSPQAFEAQLRYLVRAGYQPITLRDLIYHLTLGAPLPEKPIILTFDDGYEDNYTNAYRYLSVSDASQNGISGFRQAPASICAASPAQSSPNS